MNRWRGDWEARILEFVRREGHDGVWSYLRANPGTPLRAIAERIGEAPAVQIQQMVIAECLAAHSMPDLVRDLVVREIHLRMPDGWIAGNDFTRVSPGLLHLREPYRSVAFAMSEWLRVKAPVPNGWLPSSGEDPRMREAYSHALAMLTKQQLRLLERGEFQREPGDIWTATIDAVRKSLPRGDGDAFVRELYALRPEVRHLYAVQLCDGEVCNGGFDQFYMNSSGVLAPEAADGFDAIGLSACGDLVRTTLRFIGEPFPRRRDERERRLAAVRQQGHGQPDPLASASTAYFTLVEACSVAKAADAYASRLVD